MLLYFDVCMNVNLVDLGGKTECLEHRNVHVAHIDLHFIA